jgi:hypothetical protein
VTPVLKYRLTKPNRPGLDWDCPSPPWTGASRPLKAVPPATASAGDFAPGKKGLCPVSVFPCSVCRQRKPGKLATAYWAWFLADGERSAWKVRYCPGCASDVLSKLFSKLRSMDGTSSVFDCVLCGQDASTTSDPIYLTLYLPGKEPQEIALQLCAVCAVSLRIPIGEVGERLADRGGVVRGPSPSLTAWDALGLAPD